jgi:exosortase C (VPDSG-CTERM-specific)
MNKTNVLHALPAAVAPAAPPARRPAARPNAPLAVVAVVAVFAVFAPSLYRLLAFALGSELYSYILLIPFVSGYLAWRKRDALPTGTKPDLAVGTLLLVGGGLTLAADAWARASGVELAPEDLLAFTTTSFLLTAAGVAACFLGRAWLGALIFPIGFLVFMIPIPAGAMASIETFMQHGSAVVARALFSSFGTAVFYQDLNFQLPGINLRVAPECSGIRSTLALLIVGTVTGYFLLRSTSARLLLVALIVPLALLRNGLRIFTVGELCVRYGPQMIESYIHRHGGPLFFAASLVPFFLLVVLLQRREVAAATSIRIAAR